MELCLVPRLGDHELHVCMDDVPGEMLPHPCVVQPDHRRTGQAGAAQREDVVGGVVEQKTDMRGAIRIEAGPKEGGEAFSLGQELGVGPDPIAETQCESVGGAGIYPIPAQQRRGVRCRERHFGQRRSEGRMRFSGHPRSIPICALSRPAGRRCVGRSAYHERRRTRLPGVTWCSDDKRHIWTSS